MIVPAWLRMLLGRSNGCPQRTLSRWPDHVVLQVEPLEMRWLPSINVLVSLAGNNAPIFCGATPESRLVEDSSGDFFGTTEFGGASNKGTVFKGVAGGGIETLVSFNGTNGSLPTAGLVVDGNGDLFGTTSQGGSGSSNDGTVFEIKSGTMGISTLVNFTGTSGAAPGQGPDGDLFMDSSGDLFGTTQQGGSAANDGEVFELPAFSSGILLIAVFSGSNGAFPQGGLTSDANGNFYGNTSGGTGAASNGTVFQLVKGFGVGNYSMGTIATFSGLNGSAPTGTLVRDSSGDLFGTTVGGGAPDDGTVFELQYHSVISYTLSPLAAFNSTMNMGYDPFGGVVRDSSGNLFGTAESGGTSGNGTIFEVKNGSGTLTTLANFSLVDGSLPATGLLLDSSGDLFGTAGSGGNYNQGTVFELPAGSSSITSLGSFNGAASGVIPTGLIEDGSGNFIGTAVQGGSANDGTIFKVPAATGLVTTLANFTGTNNGADPNAGVVADGSGNLYGTADLGGLANDGTIFELPAGGSTIIKLVAFTGTGGLDPGQFPESILALDSSGDLFGTTQGGGSSNDGTVFELKFGASQITTLATFTGGNGSNPMQGVTMDSSGDLFGTTNLGGGAANLGTVYELQKSGSSYTFSTLVTFTGPNGARPDDRLTIDSSGDLFGTTFFGGPDYSSSNNGFGTVFELQKNGSSYTLTTLASFSASVGFFPRAGVIRDSSGNLFGTTTQGPGLLFLYAGTVFEVKSGSGTVTPLETITQTGEVDANLVEDSSSNLFGIGSGGAFGGVIFEVPARPPPVVTTSSLAAWTAQASGYSQTISTSGGTGSSTFSSSGTLPTGLTLASTGILSGTPTTPGSYSFTVTATDALGATGSKSYTVIINPAVTIATTTLANGIVNQPYNQTSSASGGTGALTFSQTSGTLPPGLTLGSGGGLSGTPSGAGSFTFTVKATDSVGAFGSQSYTVVIGSGKATKLRFMKQPTNTATGITLPPVTVQVVDEVGDVITTDNTDRVTVGIASGPGSFTAGSTTTATVVNGVATFNNLTVVVPGTYTLSELVSTLYTGPNSTAFTVAPLQVLPGSFAGTPSGFSLQFNTAFLVNSLTPVLYGQGFGATAPVPSVTLTQTKDGSSNPVNNPVAGSLVLNTATNSFTFLATNTALQANNSSPILPDGTYTAVVHSSAATDGFQALNPGGGFLDGLGTGMAGSGDFTQTFAVNAAAMHDDVVWVPDTADGPGQALSAPGSNQVGGGYPVYLESSGGVTNVLATVNYNPALLTVTGVTGAGFALLGSSTPGHAMLQYSGAALAAGTQTPIGFLTASVPSGTVANSLPYKAKDLLHLTSVSLNGGSAAVVADDGLHLVAYVADGDGNGAYSSNDAVLITRVALQTDTGFTAYPLVDPVIVADTDGAGFISADAALQANEAGVGFPTANLTIPPVPGGVHFQAIANNVDPALSIPSSLHVAADGTLTVTVTIDDAHPEGSTGLIRAHLALTYDAHAFTVSAADVNLGALLAGGNWSVVPLIDQATGQIAITLSSSMPISSTLAGSLITIDFHLNNPVGRISNPSSIALVAAVTPFGQYVATELEDAQGTLTLTLAPGNAFEQHIDSIGTWLVSTSRRRGEPDTSGAWLAF